MGIATYKDLCIDAVDTGTMALFWSATLGLEVDEREGGLVKLTGPTSQHSVWVNPVPEPVSAKQRVHVDLRADSVKEVEALGATVVDGDSFPWTVMKDPEGGELCVFLTRPGSSAGLYELVVDSDDAARIATWWADVLDADGKDDEEEGFSYLENIPGAPFECIVFVPVPEPKTVKNRIHIDVTTPDLQLLVDAGAKLLRPEGGDIGWNVMADPEGNEFCAFTEPR